MFQCSGNPVHASVGYPDVSLMDGGVWAKCCIVQRPAVFNGGMQCFMLRWIKVLVDFRNGAAVPYG
jgi:hypothetical protein